MGSNDIIIKARVAKGNASPYTPPKGSGLEALLNIDISNLGCCFKLYFNPVIKFFIWPKASGAFSFKVGSNVKIRGA